MTCSSLGAFVSSLVIAGALFSCRGPGNVEPPATSRTRQSASPPPSTAPALGKVETETFSPREHELERLLAEREALADPKRTFSAFPQPGPKVPYQVRSLGTFPAPGVAAKVVLYAFGRAKVAGCDDQLRAPFTKQGTLCGDVVAPGVEVTGDERAKIEALVPTAEATLAEQKTHGHWTSRASMRCGFDAHHAVALYDSTGTVIAKMLLCFTCGEWIVSPGSDATGRAEPRTMTSDERKTLAEIFDRHGLAAWACDTPLATEVSEYERRAFGTEREPTARGKARRLARLASGSGAPKDVAVRDLGRSDRAKLCEWAASEVRPTREGTGTHGYECTGGAQWVSEMTEPTCATAPSSCTKTVAEVESCLRVFREPEDLCASPGDVPAECRGLLDCLPGLVRRNGPPAP